MPHCTFRFRSLTATSAAAVASLVLGAAATSLAVGLARQCQSVARRVIAGH